MIWTIIIFVVLLIVLRKFAWGPLLAALDEREQKIKEALEQAQKTQRETELVLAENRRRTDEGFKKAEEIVQQARQEAEQMRQKMLEAAKAESRRVTEQGLRRIEAEQRAAMLEAAKAESRRVTEQGLRRIEAEQRRHGRDSQSGGRFGDSSGGPAAPGFAERPAAERNRRQVSRRRSRKAGPIGRGTVRCREWRRDWGPRSTAGASSGLWLLSDPLCAHLLDLRCEAPDHSRSSGLSCGGLHLVWIRRPLT